MNYRRQFVSQSLASGLAGSIITAIVALTWQVAADQNPATDGIQRIIPYNGVLEFDGEPVTLTGDSSPTMRFDICNDSDCTTTVFSQTMPVSVYNGSFTALIGEDNAAGVVADTATCPTCRSSIEQVMGDADDLYLKITIDAGSGEVELSNPQRLHLAPHAVWATRSTYFNVATELTVDGNAVLGNDSADVHTVNGTLNANHAVNIDGNVTVGDNASDSHTVNGSLNIVRTGDDNELLRFSTERSWAFKQEGTGAGTNLVLDNVGGPNKVFYVETDGSFRVRNHAGTTTLDANADTGALGTTGNATLGNATSDSHTINGALSVTGDVSGLSVTVGSCGWEHSSCVSRGDVLYFDRVRDVSCSNNQVMTGFNIDTQSSAGVCGNDNWRLALRCCSITVK